MPDQICPFGIFEDVSFKNKDPGESGLLHLVEIQSSDYLYNHFYYAYSNLLTWFFFQIKIKAQGSISRPLPGIQ